jgi:hypothetical protein
MSAHRRGHRKYLVGDRFADVHQAITAILAGEYLMLRGKPMHSAMLKNWPLIMIANNVAYGHLRWAVIDKPVSSDSSADCPEFAEIGIQP